MSRPLVSVAVLVLCVAAVPAARADRPAGGDPRGDAKRSRVLDIASVGDGGQTQVLTHRVTTYRSWRRALLARGGEISFYFNTDGDAAPERRLDVRYRRGALSAVMKNRRGRVVGRGIAGRPNRNSVVVRFAATLLPAGINSYRWFAFTGFRCHHRVTRCGDRAPDGGRLLTHDLRTTPAAPIPIQTPAPISNQGYRLAFRDEFNKLQRSSWRRAMHWESEQPSDVFTQDGILHIVSRRAKGFPDRSLSSLGTEKGDPRKVWKLGYFEARFKWPRGVGSAPAFWLMAASDALNPKHPGAPPPCPPVPGSFCPSAELDIFENFSVNGSARFEGTLHRNTSGRWGMPDKTRGIFRDVRFDMSTAFHTYAAKWTADEVAWYLDGVELGRVQAFDTANQPMFLILYEWTGVYGSGPNATTPDNLDMQVDWVRVWQR